MVAACLSVRVFLVVLSKSMPGGEGELCEATPAVPAALQKVQFPSKLKEIWRVTGSVFHEGGLIMK